MGKMQFLMLSLAASTVSTELQRAKDHCVLKSRDNEIQYTSDIT
jgi:hypothetical protein